MTADIIINSATEQGFGRDSSEKKGVGFSGLNQSDSQILASDIPLSSIHLFP